MRDLADLAGRVQPAPKVTRAPGFVLEPCPRVQRIRTPPLQRVLGGLYVGTILGTVSDMQRRREEAAEDTAARSVLHREGSDVVRLHRPQVQPEAAR